MIEGTIKDLLHAVALLDEENRRLRRALNGLMCWAGSSPEGPSWATPEAKKRNREMYEAAFREATSCFPHVYDSRWDDEGNLIKGSGVN